MFGIVWAGMKLRFDAVGRLAPAGYTVRNPAMVGLVTVTLSATAPTPVAGTPPRPTTVRLTDAAEWIGPRPPDKPSIVGWPLRVSMSRAGERPWNVATSVACAGAMPPTSLTPHTAAAARAKSATLLKNPFIPNLRDRRQGRRSF